MNGTLTSLNDFLRSDRLFEIPIYQRGYAWEEENLRDLWDDLAYLDPDQRAGRDDDRKHYFGTVLLKKADRKTRADLRTFEHFEVIDGQQRLTTTIILLRELTAQFKDLGDDGASGQASRLEEDYIVYEDNYKLTIGNEDKSFFHDSILAGQSATDPQTRAQTRLRDAQIFFREQFRQRREKDPDQYREFLIDFKGWMDRLEIMLYIVPSNAEAVRMFETVNDRGRPLTNLEKTKSILMYASYLVVDDPTALDTLLSKLNDHFSEIYRCFQDIEDGLGLRDAGEIQRYHHIFFIGAKDSHRHMQVLKDRLMRKSREDKKNCEAFIRSYAVGLQQAFQAMRDIAKRRRNGNALGSMIDRLFLVGRVGNLYPLLIAAWQKFVENHEREEILRLFEAFVFRGYRIVRLRSHTGLVWIHPMAHEVHRDGLSFADLRERMREMNRHYANDDSFRQALSGTHCYWNLGTRTVKYLLAQYENKLRKNAGEELRVDLVKILSAEYQTEHILPQHPAEALSEEEMAAHQDIVHRLGNLTIASEEWNREMGNRPFEEKRDGRPDSQPDGEKTCYRNSNLRVQRDLAMSEKWDEESIRQRGKEIINYALERWRIDPPAALEARAAQTSG